MSGWRNTDNKSSVPKRLAHCLSEAAVSITVTTTTDVFSFGIGTVTNIPGVQIFCIYTGVALWFTYLMQMTVFTAMMVLSGQREEQGWHCLFWGKARHPENCKHEISVNKIP